MTARDTRGKPVSPHSQKVEYSNERPSDDFQKGDIDLQTPEGRKAVVTKSRTVNGLTLERRNPAGFWHIVELPHLGAFTQFEAAVKVAELHQPETDKEGA